jgi:photoactive yellow protein
VLTTVCAWCGDSLGTPAGDGQPVSHGMCAACAASSGVFPVETLLTLSQEELDALPYGVIELDEHARVRGYNRAEERLSGLPRDRFLGRHFFTEVAPCTRVAEFEGRFHQILASTTPAEEEFSFVFRFARGHRFVLVRLGYAPEPRRAFISVRSLG